jgi:DNA-binding Lrp family transcriptional regulator
MTRPLLDELDRRLIGALHLAPRATWDDIGEILAADASTLKRRYDRLHEARMVRVIGQADWGIHSTAMPVHVFLDITGESPLAVLHRLRDLPHLQLLAQISGDYPLYAVVHAPSEAATSEAIDRMFSVPGVRRVNALPALSTLRRGITWDPQFLTDTERAELLKLTGTRPEGTATATPPAKPLSEAERGVVASCSRTAARPPRASPGPPTWPPPPRTAWSAGSWTRAGSSRAWRSCRSGWASGPRSSSGCGWRRVRPPK